ncbi:Transcription termination factor, mitochondrial [Sergentomyia squamirostris]
MKWCSFIRNFVVDSHKQQQVLLTKLSSLLQCNKNDVEKLLATSRKMKLKEQNRIMDSAQFLLEQKISPESVLENPWLLLQTEDSLREKLISIHDMNPWELPDFVPLMRITQFGLQKLVRKYRSERKFIPGGHRVYFLSSRLGVQPKIISKHLSTRQFMFNIPFKSLSSVLSVMMKYNIAPMDILRDLWVFRYNPEALELRLGRAKEASVEKSMPWMARCTVPVFEKHLQISEDTRAVLGENRTTVEYLSERLGYDVDTMREITSRRPAILRVRMTKIKEFLDFLLLEAGFTPRDLVRVPQILTHSIETTRMRLKELKQHGCVPTSLSIVCLSQRNYQKFLHRWINKND